MRVRMSWIIPIWSIAAGACLSFAALHFVVWLGSRASLVNLLLSVAALAGCAIALQEMVLMHAQTPTAYGELFRWMHVSIAVIIIAIVWMVRLHLGAGRVWLAWLVSGLRIVVLLADFLTSPSATFREITGLRFVPWLGEVVSIPVGEPSPWRILLHVNSVLLLFYALDAGGTAWRRGDRRRAVFLSGPIAAAILLSVLFSQLMVWKAIDRIGIPPDCTGDGARAQYGSDSCQAEPIIQDKGRRTPQGMRRRNSISL
jgi:hypothetical protein